MHIALAMPFPRRRLLTSLPAAVGALVLARGLAADPRAAAQTDQMTVSGGGVNLKPMPSPDGKGTVPLRELFALDAHYAQCVIEDNPARFAMDTFAMGRVVIEPHTFFMAMYANDVSLVGVYDAGGGKRLARLTGALDCATDAVLLSSMDVPGVRGLRKEIQLLRELNLMPSSAHVVMNFADRHGGLSAADVATTIGTPIDVLVPRSRAVPSSTNQGLPLLQVQSKDPAAVALRQLVRRLSPVVPAIKPIRRWTPRHRAAA